MAEQSKDKQPAEKKPAGGATSDAEASKSNKKTAKAKQADKAAPATDPKELDLAALDAEISAQLDQEAANAGPTPEWFVIHSYSGMEHKVKKNIEHRAESMGMNDRIMEVVVPTETEIEIRNGVRREVERRVFPGYILVNMIMDEDSWYVVRNSPGVTGFVGMGNKPTPLRQEEVDKIMQRIESPEGPRIKVSFQRGEHVRIMSGPFAEFSGLVDEIFPDKGKARVMVSFFNRETPVEVDFIQLERDA